MGDSVEKLAVALTIRFHQGWNLGELPLPRPAFGSERPLLLLILLFLRHAEEPIPSISGVREQMPAPKMRKTRSKS